ncbi:MAG: Gfo/Idh/MocA family protein [Sphaerochaeta sp.]
MDKNKGTGSLKIGLIGCGRVAENHLLAVSKCQGAEVIVAGGGSSASDFCRRHGLELASPQEIIEREDIDAILVLTPHTSHYEYAMTAMDKGKHVLIEKPVSFDLAEMKSMKDLARSRSVVCFPGHSYLYSQDMMRMIAAAHDGTLGQIAFLFTTETYYMEEQLFVRYEGPQVDILCHHLYMMLALVGMPQSVSAVTTSYPASVVPTEGPQIGILIKTRGNTIVTTFLSWAVDDHTSTPFTHFVKILGTGGALQFNRRDFVLNKEDGGYEQPIYQEMFDNQMKYFIYDCIMGGKDPLSTIEDAERVLHIHQDIMQAVRTGATVPVEEV